MIHESDKTTIWQPLRRAEVVRAVERRHPSRIPLVFARWWGEGLLEQHGEHLRALETYPEDASFTLIDPIRYDDMGLSWPLHAGRAASAPSTAGVASSSRLSVISISRICAERVTMGRRSSTG